jgi:Leucine-rich repeat (LRR) protein
MILIKIVLITSMVSGENAIQNELRCEFSVFLFDQWPGFQYCRVTNAYFSNDLNTTNFTFSGNPVEKLLTTVVKFLMSGKMDFLPPKMFEEFPFINGIIIWMADIPVLKNDLFGGSPGFEKIFYLHLLKNNIKEIEPDAFRNMPKLKWIDLGGNELRVLNDKFFKYNPDLEATGFAYNKLKAINPQFFSHLHKLNKVHMSRYRTKMKNFKEFTKVDWINKI